jgi:predicted  nucleic acid-binding Zn-ribbon protein
LLAASGDVALAESMILQPAESGWNLEAMMETRKHLDNGRLDSAKEKRSTKIEPKVPVDKATDRNTEAKVRALTAAHMADKRIIAQLTATLAKLRKQQEQGQGQGQSTAEQNTLQAKLQSLTIEAQAASESTAQLRSTLIHKEEELTDLRAKLAAAAVTAEHASTLTAREEALRQASVELAEQREKILQQETPALSTAAARQAYMAGVIMSQGVSTRLTDWKDAGVTLIEGVFRAGLNDGLLGTVRLNPSESDRAGENFARAIQVAAAGKVAAAQQQMQALAKGRTPLKSSNGIVWYRIKKGHAVPAVQPVILAMTEQIAGGKIINNIPPMPLRDNDDMPTIVKDGLHLPGDGGEVVAYALARSVYGGQPLPDGVRPYTVMEYHLRGGKPTSN